MEKSVHSKTANRLKKALIDARKRKGLTQVALAKKLGKAQSFVSYYEKGLRRIDVIELIQICRILNINTAKLIDSISDDK